MALAASIPMYFRLTAESIKDTGINCVYYQIKSVGTVRGRYYRKTLPSYVFKFGPLPNAYISCSTRALFHFSVYFTHYSAIYVKMSTYLQFHLA